MPLPVLYIVIPCYNEQEVLPLTGGLFVAKLQGFITAGRVSPQSRVLLVNDGSKDDTWAIITALHAQFPLVEGLCLSRNRGHQNALLCGLECAKERSDVTISIDCDGQDDLNAMDAMLAEYDAGCDIVYGVRSSRSTDTAFKRGTAQFFYKLMGALGADVVYNHADYRLMSKRALDALAQFKEVNLFLRGLVPLVGFRTCSVYYERRRRMGGKSHYPVAKMLAFALDGITSLSVKPLRLITWLGFLFSLTSVAAIIATIVQRLVGFTTSGWASTLCIVLFMGGVQLLCLGVLGEYIGKLYSEAKGRPRYIISEDTFGGERGAKPLDAPKGKEG